MTEWTLSTLKEHFDSQITNIRDVEIRATTDRETKAQALRETERLATDAREKERDNTARVEREHTAHEIRTGDQSLKDHIDHQRESISKAEKSVDKRLEQMNEIRGTLNDQALTFVGREIFEQFEKEARRMNETTASACASVSTRVTEIEARSGGGKDAQETTAKGRNLMLAIIGTGVAIIGAMTTVSLAVNAYFA